MKLKLTCKCGSVLSVSPEWVGREIPCFDCGEMVKVVLPQEETHEVEAVAEEEAIELEVLEEEEPVELELLEEEDIPEVEVEIESPEDAVTEELVRTGRLIQLDVPAPCLAFGAGGAWGLAGQEDDVQILNLKSGKRMQRYCDHDDPITSVALALDGEFALSADEAGEVFYWELLSRKRKKRLKGHQRAVRVLAISQQSQLALTGSDDGSTRLWSLATGKEYSLEEGEWAEKVTAVAFARNAELVAAGGAKGHVNVWNSKSGERLRWFETSARPIGSVGFSSDGKSVFAVARPAGGEGTTARHPQIWRWDVQTGRPQACFHNAAPATCVPAIAVLDHAGKRLVVAGTQPANAAFLKGRPSLEIWNLAAGTCLHTFADVQGLPLSLAVAPESTRFLVALDNRRVQVFSLPAI